MYEFQIISKTIFNVEYFFKTKSISKQWPYFLQKAKKQRNQKNNLEIY